MDLLDILLVKNFARGGNIDPSIIAQIKNKVSYSEMEQYISETLPSLTEEELLEILK